MTKGTTFWYSRPEHGSHRYAVETGRQYSWAQVVEDEWDAEMLAEACAEDFHVNHDGWEATWPIVFALYESKDGPEVARYEVDREAVPSFSATPVPADHPQES